MLHSTVDSTAYAELSGLRQVEEYYRGRGPTSLLAVAPKNR